MITYNNRGKRVFDVAFSAMGFVLTSWILFIVSILVKLDSRGKVFFTQERIGRNGRIFRLIKFRSMYSDASIENRGFNPGERARITSLGKILRKTKLDELPQLINVLKGDMSFVGPRPEVERYRAMFRGKYEEVLSLRPGITDWASIAYCNEEELLAQSTDPEKLYREDILPNKLMMALEYKENISFKTDIGIIFNTLARISRSIVSGSSNVNGSRGKQI
jgi:lipopolysaccharide/colanic/teichoic acid biosynthesis glycosyltransferase